MSKLPIQPVPQLQMEVALEVVEVAVLEVEEELLSGC